MLNKYLKINGELMPNPVSFKGITPNPQENVFFSEGGRRMTNIVRLDRPSWAATFQCTSRMKAKLETFCKSQSVTSSFNNEPTMTGTLRMSGSPTLVKNSEFCNNTDGLWEISVIFEGE